MNTEIRDENSLFFVAFNLGKTLNTHYFAVTIVVKLGRRQKNTSSNL